MKAVFLDRDGTLNHDPGYVHKLEDLKLLEGVVDALKMLKEVTLFIVTNQSGIGRGHFTEEQMHSFNDALLAALRKDGIAIKHVLYCPHHPDDACGCRKPHTKLVKQAAEEYGITLSTSWVVGDRIGDTQMGKRAGCKAVHLLTGHGVHDLEAVRKEQPYYIAKCLKQAMRIITFDQDHKIVAREDLISKIEEIRENGRSHLVTLNGAFDIFHEGHRKIIKEAKEQGDVLIMAINSDAAIKKSKGPTRPLNTAERRAELLASFEDIDYVTVFDEETPLPLLEIIKPDVHVNGSDYGKECIESETVKRYGGRVHIVDLLPGHSTTNLVSKKRQTL